MPIDYTKLVNLEDAKAGMNTEHAMIASNYSSASTYAVGAYAYYAGTLYKCTTAITTAEAWNSAHWAEAKLGNDLISQSEKIEAIEETLTNEGLEDFVVGTSEQLLADTGVNDQVPYIFRKAPDKASRLTDKIVGGTIAWNQLCKSGSGTETKNELTLTANSDGSYTVNGTASADTDFNISDTLTIPTSHPVLIIGCPSGGSESTYMICDGYYNAALSGDFGSGRIYKKSLVTSLFRIKVKSGVEVTNLKFMPQAFDLAQMFGSAVADQIYAMEQATAGAGVAFFKSLFPKPYYAYNAGDLMSVKTSAHVTRGKNLADPSLLIDGYTDFSSHSYISSYIGKTQLLETAGLGGKTIRLSGTGINRCYVSYYNSIPTAGDISETTPANYNDYYYFTINANYKYVAIQVVYNADISDIQLEFGTVATAYEPYESHTYPLDSSLTLRGIPKLDANNKVYYDGDTYESDGKVTRRYGVVDLGTLNWDYSTEHNNYFWVGNAVPAGINLQMICGRYERKQWESASTLDTGDKFITTDNGFYLYIKDLSYTDAATFKTAMSGVYLVYELATPTTETADPFTNPQICSPYGTEEYVDSRDVAVPVGHDTFYHEDLKGKIEGLPWDLSVIAPVLTEFKADTALVANDFRMINNELYRITASIASGGTITPNTNATKTDIATILKGLLT